MQEPLRLFNEQYKAAYLDILGEGNLTISPGSVGIYGDTDEDLDYIIAGLIDIHNNKGNIKKSTAKFLDRALNTKHFYRVFQDLESVMEDNGMKMSLEQWEYILSVAAKREPKKIADLARVIRDIPTTQLLIAKANSGDTDSQTLLISIFNTKTLDFIGADFDYSEGDGKISASDIAGMVKKLKGSKLSWDDQEALTNNPVIKKMGSDKKYVALFNKVFNPTINAMFMDIPGMYDGTIKLKFKFDDMDAWDDWKYFIDSEGEDLKIKISGKPTEEQTFTISGNKHEIWKQFGADDREANMVEYTGMSREQFVHTIEKGGVATMEWKSGEWEDGVYD